MKRRLAQSLAQHLDELGLTLRAPVELIGMDEYEVVDATVSHRRGVADYRVGYGETLVMSPFAVRWAHENAGRSERFLFLGPRITERSAQIFRQHGIQFLDAAGNAFIDFDGVHIDVRGRRSHAEEPNEPRVREVRGGVNLFSTKRAQVAFVVLSWPELLSAPLREVARVAGVSLGQAQQTLEMLASYGFLDEERRMSPERRARLIDEWTAAYPRGLGASDPSDLFSGDTATFGQAADALASHGAEVRIGGEAAVPWLLRPSSLVLYVNTFPTDLVRANRWRRDRENPNVFLRPLFWAAPRGEEENPRFAPWLLVYADLLSSGDSRQREAARELRTERDHAR